MMRHSHIALLLLGLGPLAAFAQDPAVLSLEQAVAVALESNDRLLAAAAESGAAEAGLAEARAFRLPVVEFSETVSRSTNPTLVFSNLLGQESFGQENFAIDRLNEPDALTHFSSRLSITQPLWTGGRIRYGIDAATLARDASAAHRERTRQEVVHQVIDAYTAQVLATARHEVAAEAVETARANVKLVKDLHDGGLVVRSDLLQAQVRLSEVQELLIRAEADIAIGQAAVNLALGRDLGTPFSIPPSLAVESGTEQPLEPLIEQALAARPDLEAARIGADAAESNMRIERAAGRPQVGITGQFEANSNQALDIDGTNWTVFAGARLTLFDGGATGSRVKQADQRRVQAERLRDGLADRVSLDVRRAFHDLRAARQTREQAEAAVELARESLRIVEDRYKEGLSTVVELLEAETSVTRARTRATAARRDIVLAGATLDLAVGRL